jgi:hypothetical protein
VSEWMMITVELPEDDAFAVQNFLRNQLGFEVAEIKRRPALKRRDGSLARWIPMPSGGFIRPETEGP